MSILLLAECWPYRNVEPNSFDTSQMRLLAQACNVTVKQLQHLCTCRYVIEGYVPSFKRDVSYAKTVFNRVNNVFLRVMLRHDITIMIGKRLMNVLASSDANFFIEYYTMARNVVESIDLTVACIPNPMAEFYWKDTKNVDKVSKFMKHVFEVYGD